MDSHMERIAKALEAISTSLATIIEEQVMADADPDVITKAPISKPTGAAALEVLKEAAVNAGTGKRGRPRNALEQAAVAVPDVPKYEDVRSLIVRVAETPGLGREVSLDILSKFGVDHGTKLMPEMWPNVIAELSRALAGVDGGAPESLA